MSMDDQKDEAALDALFDAGRSNAPEPTPDFMARLAADAEMALPRTVNPATPSPAPRVHWLTGFFTASGLSGAAVLGVWIGFAMPETLDSFSLTTDDSVALSTFLPGADLGAAFDE